MSAVIYFYMLEVHKYMLLLSRNDIKDTFTMRDAVEADKKAFALTAAGRIDVPLRIQIDEKCGGSFVVMASYSQDMDVAAVKDVNIFPQNMDKGLKTAPAQVMLVDGVTGYITAIIDGDYVTKIRTGGASGAAFDVLAKKNCRKGCLIGTGGQAETQLEAMVTVRDLEEVMVFDTVKERAQEFCRKMQAELSGCKAKFIAADSSDEAVEDADMIITVTSSPVPVFDATKVKAGATLSCVGTFQPEKHEMDPRILDRASKVFCDQREAVLGESGDLIIPINEGTFDADRVVNLGDVINGIAAGRENDDEIIVFETVGVGAQDLIASKVIYDKAVAAGAGLNWE